ncbi:MAG: hypothetical protein JRN37_00605 [Nitrososphaerota archaeon]|jgi:hypothetical protein|nr:hypothetical protein [Nitrososphaerota archaeon]MDG7037485.1 hypothetical protein [Nitrososphaerota archaeon]MDG7037652.1 hypothetical protein [Nitrososphaerota archaeon]
MFNSDTILRDMNSLVSSYINCWKKGENRFITPAQPTGIDGKNLLLADNFTDCEARYLLFRKLDEQSKQLVPRYRIEELPYEVVIRLPILLTRSLRAQSVCFDHRVLWSWIAQLFTNITRIGTVQDAALSDRELIETFELLVSLELANLSKPPINSDAYRLNQVIDIVVSWHVRRIVDNKYKLALTLSFPTLERVLRNKCSSYVDNGGKVLRSFSVKGKKYNVKDRISSMEHLLYLYEENIAPPDFKKLVEDFKAELLEIFPNKKDAYDLLYSWRNDQLHGGELDQTYHAVLLNLASLFLLDSLKQVYERLRSLEKNSAMRSIANTPWNFYPPELF